MGCGVRFFPREAHKTEDVTFSRGFAHHLYLISMTNPSGQIFIPVTSYRLGNRDPPKLWNSLEDIPATCLVPLETLLGS